MQSLRLSCRICLTVFFIIMLQGCVPRPINFSYDNQLMNIPKFASRETQILSLARELCLVRRESSREMGYMTVKLPLNGTVPPSCFQASHWPGCFYSPLPHYLPQPLVFSTVTSSKVSICLARDRIDVVTSLLLLLPLRGSWSVFQAHPIIQRDSNESFRLQHPVLDGNQSRQYRMIQSDMLATSQAVSVCPQCLLRVRQSCLHQCAEHEGEAHGLVNQLKPG